MTDLSTRVSSAITSTMNAKNAALEAISCQVAWIRHRNGEAFVTS
jgi:hypothetical protein